jgi:predicted  nucleic acid-binding Zn-ribbon protein
MRELLAVQTLDTATDQARHAVEHSPLRTLIADLDRSIAQGESARTVVQGNLDGIRKEQRRFEDEASLVSDKGQSIESQLYGGGKSMRELEALQADLDSLHRRQGVLEDQAIEQMEAAEPVAAQLEAVDAKLEQLRSERDAAAQALIVEEAEAAAKIAELSASRAEACSPNTTACAPNWVVSPWPNSSAGAAKAAT